MEFNWGARAIKASQLVEWCGSDLTRAEYTPHARSVPVFMAEYVIDKDMARSLRREQWTMTYLDFDWKLNVKR